MDFEQSNKLAPLFYLIIVGSYIADLTVFNYEFSLYEIIGTIIILTNVMTPIIKDALK